MSQLGIVYALLGAGVAVFLAGAGGCSCGIRVEGSCCWPGSSSAGGGWRGRNAGFYGPWMLAPLLSAQWGGVPLIVYLFRKNHVILAVYLFLWV